MNIDEILETMEAERDRLDQAIAILRGHGTGKRTWATGLRRARGPQSAAARLRISQAMKKTWAERKKRLKSQRNQS
jgi:hypothetical protein